MSRKAKEEKIITMVGVKQARKGFEFLHESPSEKCEKCKYYRVCIGNLEAGRVYRIVGLREKTFPCPLHEGGVRVVEVVESGRKRNLCGNSSENSSRRGSNNIS